MWLRPIDYFPFRKWCTSVKRKPSIAAFYCRPTDQTNVYKINPVSNNNRRRRIKKTRHPSPIESAEFRCSRVNSIRFRCHTTHIAHDSTKLCILFHQNGSQSGTSDSHKMIKALACKPSAVRISQDCRVWLVGLREMGQLNSYLQ